MTSWILVILIAFIVTIMLSLLPLNYSLTGGYLNDFKPKSAITNTCVSSSCYLSLLPSTAYVITLLCLFFVEQLGLLWLSWCICFAVIIIIIVNVFIRYIIPPAYHPHLLHYCSFLALISSHKILHSIPLCLELLKIILRLDVAVLIMVSSLNFYDPGLFASCKQWGYQSSTSINSFLVWYFC